MEPMNSSCLLFDFVVCAILIGLICVAGLIGNATSFLVLCKHRTDTSTVFLLQCMAISDSILLVTTLLIYSFPAIHPYTGHMLKFHEICDQMIIYVWPIAMMTHTATIWMTVLVTLNRFCAVCRPMKSIRKNTNGVRLQVCLVIVLSVLYNLPRFFEHQPLELSSHSTQNMTDGSGNSSSPNDTSRPVILGDSKLYQIIYSNVLYFPVMYIIPLLSLGYMNTRLIRSLKAVKKRKETLTGHRPKEDHITQCIVVIVCVFIICQTPALANQIFWAALSNSDRECGHFHFYYTKLSDTLVVLNSSCNFVIYCLFGKSFRKIFLDTLCIAKIRSKSNAMNSSDETCRATNGASRTVL